MLVDVRETVVLSDGDGPTCLSSMLIIRIRIAQLQGKMASLE